MTTHITTSISWTAPFEKGKYHPQYGQSSVQNVTRSSGPPKAHNHHSSHTTAEPQSLPSCGSTSSPSSQPARGCSSSLSSLRPLSWTHCPPPAASLPEDVPPARPPSVLSAGPTVLPQQPVCQRMFLLPVLPPSSQLDPLSSPSSQSARGCSSCPSSLRPLSWTHCPLPAASLPEDVPPPCLPPSSQLDPLSSPSSHSARGCSSCPSSLRPLSWTHCPLPAASLPEDVPPPCPPSVLSAGPTVLPQQPVCQRMFLLPVLPPSSQLDPLTT